jgi:hypothetical protein
MRNLARYVSDRSITGNRWRDKKYNQRKRELACRAFALRVAGREYGEIAAELGVTLDLEHELVSTGAWLHDLQRRQEVASPPA